MYQDPCRGTPVYAACMPPVGWEVGNVGQCDAGADAP
jgi:hypothetical protein